MSTIGSAHIRRRSTAKGEARFQVRYRLGGRGCALRHGGSFRKLADAREREAYIRTGLLRRGEAHRAARPVGGMASGVRRRSRWSGAEASIVFRYLTISGNLLYLLRLPDGSLLPWASWSFK